MVCKCDAIKNSHKKYKYTEHALTDCYDYFL